MASSEPTPTKRFSGVMAFPVWARVPRRSHSCCLSSCWCGSG